MNVLISAPSSSAPAAPGLFSATTAELRSKPVVVTAGRGVLDGAFAVLDALAHADEGLGLTALARVSGLAKTSAHRLAEQLVTLGAVSASNTATMSGRGCCASGSAGSRIRCYGGARRSRSILLPCNRAPWRRCGSCMNIDSAISVPPCLTATPT